MDAENKPLLSWLCFTDDKGCVLPGNGIYLSLITRQVACDGAEQGGQQGVGILGSWEGDGREGESESRIQNSEEDIPSGVRIRN